MAQAKLAARPSKTIIGANAVDFVGYELGQGISRPLENLEKLKNAPRPTTKKEVQSFPGLTSFYSDFVPNCAAIAVPLTDLTEKGSQNNVVWAMHKRERIIL